MEELKEGVTEVKTSDGMFSSGKIQLTAEFKEVLNIMENGDDILFVYGSAGTGKSTLIHHFMEHTKKKTALLAPTGVAAVNIGGSTVHSFFKFPPRAFKTIPHWDYLHTKMVKAVDLIVIDEVSMIRSDVLTMMDKTLRKYVNDKLPFGGKQIVMVGDMYQLPPIIGSPEEKDMLKAEYGSEYFFDALPLVSYPFEKRRLSVVFRQNDRKYIGFLNRMKRRALTENDYNVINGKTYYGRKMDPLAPTVCSYVKTAEAYNDNSLRALPGEERLYSGTFTGTFNERNAPASLNLRLKKDARVIMCTNAQSFFNGQMGTVTELEDNHVHVLLDGCKAPLKVERYEYDQYAYTYDQAKQTLTATVVGTFTQFPMKLGYGITIHKSQSQTYEKVNIDLGRRVFAHGQTYVAFSRCTNVDGISMSRPLRRDDIIVDNRILEFDRSLAREKAGNQ